MRAVIPDYQAREQGERNQEQQGCCEAERIRLEDKTPAERTQDDGQPGSGIIERIPSESQQARGKSCGGFNGNEHGGTEARAEQCESY